VEVVNEDLIQRAMQSGVFSSRDEISNHLYERSMLRENSLIEAVARGDDIGSVCELVYPTLLRIRRMAGNYEPLDLSSFRGE
jgi:hypothetical protein